MLLSNLISTETMGDTTATRRSLRIDIRPRLALRKSECGEQEEEAEVSPAMRRWMIKRERARERERGRERERKRRKGEGGRDGGRDKERER